MMQHTNMLRRFSVALGVGGKEKCGKTYEFFKERQQQELYHCEFFFSFLLQTYSENGTEIFLFFLIMLNSSVRNFCKYFSLGNFWIKYDCTADVFPISHQWKDISVYHPYVQYILIHATNKMPCSGSLLKYQHLQCDACNSDGSFVCKYCSNCVLFFVPARLFWRLSCWCSVWWCQKTFCHVPPLARLWYMIDKQLRQDQLCLFFCGP